VFIISFGTFPLPVVTGFIHETAILPEADFKTRLWPKIGTCGPPYYHYDYDYDYDYDYYYYYYSCC